MGDDKKSKPGSIHAGHRQRMKEQFLVRGLDGMSDHQILELLLFFAIPQGDVNPLAHALVNRFGTLSSVLSANYEDLLTVKGIGPNAATLIHLIPDLCKHFSIDQAHLGGRLTKTVDYKEELKPYFFGSKVELCYMLCMDGTGKVITCCKLGEGTLDQVNIPQRKVVEEALRHNASQVVLAHNHVSGLAIPSNADISFTSALKKLLWDVDVVLVDSLIIAGENIVSMARANYFFE